MDKARRKKEHLSTEEIVPVVLVSFPKHSGDEAKTPLLRIRNKTSQAQLFERSRKIIGFW